MAPKRKRTATVNSQTNGAQSNGADNVTLAPVAAATPDEKRAWQGFCEIESEPAFFNVMLKEFGVQGVKVQEVFSLDEDMLALLPKPIYGLIFLFRYKADAVNNQEATCPDHVWFANQTADFSCATVSLLNIVYNIRDAQLGPQLQAFKDFTKDFTPALRGQAIENFAFVKEIHNSFARKMDMLSIDLGLQNAYDDRRKSKTTTQTKQGSKKSAKKNGVVTDEDYDDNAAFHFSAFVPIDGEVWKLDGLDRQPERINTVAESDDWLSMTMPIIEDRMNAYAEGQIEFVLLGLVKDPLDALRVELAQNIKAIQSVTRALEISETDREASDQAETETYGADAILQITENMIKEATVPEHVQLDLDNAVKDYEATDLGSLRTQLINENQRLRREVLDEMNSYRGDEQRASERRNDYGPAIYAWLRMLARKDEVIKEIIESVQASENGGTYD